MFSVKTVSGISRDEDLERVTDVQWGCMLGLSKATDSEYYCLLRFGGKAKYSDAQRRSQVVRHVCV